MDQPRRSAPPRTGCRDPGRALRALPRVRAAPRRQSRPLLRGRAASSPRLSSSGFASSAPAASTHGSRAGLIVASNHRSFLDPFVIGASLPWRRQIQFVAKVELFEKRWVGWILSRLGAFPIRRGQSDEVAMETARIASSAAAPWPSSRRERVIRYGVARLAQARRRALRARGRRLGPAGRGARQRARPPRLSHPPAQGEAPRSACR